MKVVHKVTCIPRPSDPLMLLAQRIRNYIRPGKVEIIPSLGIGLELAARRKRERTEGKVEIIPSSTKNVRRRYRCSKS